jgi:copper(I)-binding protein
MRRFIMRTIAETGKFVWMALFSLVALSMFAACESGPPQISIEDATAMMSPAIIGEAMVTMKIDNQGGPDVLTSVKADIPGARISLHIMQGERMVAADTLKIAAKKATEFKMGSSHIMIEDMPKTMKAGSKIDLTLVFQKSGEKKVSLTLQPASAMPMDHHHM